MEFTLVYQGRLKANGNPKDKQAFRRVFHKQLKELWTQPPLDEFGPPTELLWTDVDPKEIPIIQEVGDFKFAPLVNQQLHLIAELHITMLRPEPPGAIVTQGGDIDNRIKTLLDSLKMPKEMGEIPKDDSPKENEDPFFCLLEDDNLITKLTVVTDRLLEPCDNPSFVNLLIHVQTKATKLTFHNMGLA